MVMVRILVADIAQNDITVEVHLGKSGVVVEENWWGDGLGAVGDTGVESKIGIIDLDSDGADGEAMCGGESARSGVVEGGDGRRGRGAKVFHGGNRWGVGGSEEEAELARAEEVGGVGQVAGGKVGLGNDGHAEAPGEATGRVSGVSAPELDVVESLNAESIRPGVGPNELGEAEELELGLISVIVIITHGLGFCKGKGRRRRLANEIMAESS